MVYLPPRAVTKEMLVNISDILGRVLDQALALQLLDARLVVVERLVVLLQRLDRRAAAASKARLLGQ